MIEPILLALIGYVVGGILRTAYDYLWHILENPTAAWDQKYTVTFLISINISFISGLVTFNTITIPTDLPGTVGILLFTLGQGFMVNHLVNKPVTYLAERKEAAVAVAAARSTSTPAPG